MGGERPDFCTEMIDQGLQDDLTKEEKGICGIEGEASDDLGPEPGSNEEERLYKESMKIEEERQREEDKEIWRKIESGEGFSG